MLPSGRVRSAPLFGSAVLMWGSTCRPETAGRSKTRRVEAASLVLTSVVGIHHLPAAEPRMVLRDVAAAPGSAPDGQWSR